MNDNTQRAVQYAKEAAAYWRSELEAGRPLPLWNETAEEFIARQYQRCLDEGMSDEFWRKRAEMEEGWRKQAETRAAKEKYFEGIFHHGELKHPPAADMVRRSFFGPRLDHLDDDLERCLKSAHASPAIAVIHEDDDSFSLQVELQDDRAVVISFSKHDGEAYTSIWTGSGEHDFADDSIKGWKEWAEIATGKRPRPQ